jgi:hypothetical protein
MYIYYFEKPYIIRDVILLVLYLVGAILLFYSPLLGQKS